MEEKETVTDLAERPAEEQRALEVRTTMGDSMERLRGLLTGRVEDEATRDLIKSAGGDLKTKVKEVQGLRARWYDPERLRVEALRAVYDTPLKLADSIIRSAESAITEYNERKRREAQVAREKAEAEARRAREEADRKRREAEEAERRAKAEAEARKRREEEEKMRLEREKLERERREFEAAKAEQARKEAELKRKREEEEKARLDHAIEAERVGNTDKVDTTLERAKPLPVAAPVIPEGPTPEEITAQALKETEEREAREKAQREAAEARQREEEEKERARQAKEAADKAAAEAKEAEMRAAATTTIMPKGVTRHKYRIAGAVEFRAFLEAVVQASLNDPRALEYAGYNPEKPDGFRSSALTKDVTRLKDAFRFPGVETWSEVVDQIKANEAQTEPEDVI